MSMKTGKFVRTEKQPAAGLRGQAALVMNSLDAHPEGADLGTITTEIVDLGLVTRQEPQRIALYYLAIFKRQGLITQLVEKPAGEPVTEPAAVASGTETPEVIFESAETEQPAAELVPTE